MLQHNTEEIGQQSIRVIVDGTPKYHSEVAGEGVEYSWALCKLFWRGVPVQLRRGYAQFIKHLALSLSQTEGTKLTKQQIWKLSARARNYIAAYHILAAESKQYTHTSILKKDIDKMRKVYRTHQEIFSIESRGCTVEAVP